MVEFLAMGGYGGFVWPAFGITAAVLIALAVVSRRSVSQRETLLAALRASAARDRETRS